MENRYPHLLSPITIGKVTYRNRIFSSPVSLQCLSAERTLTPENIAFYEMRAKGGAANVTIGCTNVLSTGRAHYKELEMDNPSIMYGLRHAVRSIKRHGAVPNIELGHGGKYAGIPNLENPDPGHLPYGPIYEVIDGVEIHQLDEGQILELVEAFGRSAKMIKQAGFEMVMLHGAHGWLLDQFLSPTNTREDKYGGCLENRLRFPIMVLKAVREAVGSGFPIEFRINASQNIEGGTTLEEAIEICKGLDDYVDMFNVSVGNQSDPECFVRTHPDMFKPHGINVELAAEIKKNVKSFVSTVGAMNELDKVEEYIALGKVDVVEFARELISDPFMPSKAREGRYDEIVKCMRCHWCMASIIELQDIACTLNPVIGEEERFFNRSPIAAKSKKVLVAGGGPGGMEAAIQAAERGHRVILCEKSDELGGMILNEKHVEFKKNFYSFAHDYLPGMIKKNPNIELRMNTEVTPALVEEIKPDAIVCAIGSTPIIPPIPGIDDKRVIFATDLKRDDLEIGENVVIIGGGLVGSESAVEYKNRGKHVTVIEMQNDFAVDANIFHKMALQIQVRDGIDMRTGMRVVAINEEGVLAEDKEGKQSCFKADTILCAVGLRPRRAETDAIRNMAGEFRDVGDCVKVGMARTAIHHGYYAGLDL